MGGCCVFGARPLDLGDLQRLARLQEVGVIPDDILVGLVDRSPVLRAAWAVVSKCNQAEALAAGHRMCGLGFQCWLRTGNGRSCGSWGCGSRSCSWAGYLSRCLRLGCRLGRLLGGLLSCGLLGGLLSRPLGGLLGRSLGGLLGCPLGGLLGRSLGGLFGRSLGGLLRGARAGALVRAP